MSLSCTQPFRRQQASAPTGAAARPDAAARFRTALDGEHHDHEGRQSAGDSDSAPHQRGADRFAEGGRALPLDVQRMFRASLEQGLADAQECEDALEHLLRDIALGVRSGHTLPGTRWRLLVRLQPEFFPATEVDIGCVDGRLDIVLRTATQAVYSVIVAALPRLDAALAARNSLWQPAAIFLVSAKDLQ